MKTSKYQIYEDDSPYHTNPSSLTICPYCGEKETKIKVSKKVCHCICRLHYWGPLLLKFFDFKYGLACKAEDMSWRYFSKDTINGKGNRLEMFLYWTIYRHIWVYAFYPIKKIKLIAHDIYPVLWILIFHPLELIKTAWDRNCWKLLRFSKPIPFPDDHYQGKYIAELAHEAFYKWG